MKLRIYLLFFLVLTISLSFVFSTKGVIDSKYKSLVGKYKLIFVQQEKQKRNKATIKDSFMLEIRSNDKLIFYKNAKKLAKYSFSATRSPVEEVENYVLFNTNEGFFPLYYSGDTVWNFYQPYNYEDCYFLKIKSTK